MQPSASVRTARAMRSSTASTSSPNDETPSASPAGPGTPQRSTSMPGTSRSPTTVRSKAPETRRSRPYDTYSAPTTSRPSTLRAT